MEVTFVLRYHPASAAGSTATPPVRKDVDGKDVDFYPSWMLLGDANLEPWAILLVRVALGVFFAISGGNKLFVASRTKVMYETLAAAKIPFPRPMTYCGEIRRQDTYPPRKIAAIGGE